MAARGARRTAGMDLAARRAPDHFQRCGTFWICETS